MPTRCYASVPHSGPGWVTNPGGLARDLVAFWPLDELNGTRYDRVGASHLFEFGGAIGSGAGVAGNARSAAFVGSAGPSLTAKPNLFHMNGDRPLTVGLWLLTTTSGFVMRVVMKNNFPVQDGLDWEIVMSYPTPNQIGFGVDDGGVTRSLAATTGWTVGTWHHVFCWYDPHVGSYGAINVQVNDLAVAQSQLTSGLGCRFQNHLSIGRRGGGGSTTYPISGRVQDLAIWKRVLTVDERQAIYRAGLVGRRWFCTSLSPEVLRRFWMFTAAIEHVTIAPPVGGATGTRYALSPLGGHLGSASLPGSPTAGNSGAASRPGSPIGGARSKA